MNHWKLIAALTCALTLSACGDPPEPPVVSTAAAGSALNPAVTGRVYIISPTDGAVVSSPLTVSFGIDGYAVAPAGTYEANTGHHHLLIDTGLPPLNQPIPADAQHVHFGKGQTETTLELAPGPHTLQLLLGDGNHVPHQPPLTSDIITVTVSE